MKLLVWAFALIVAANARTTTRDSSPIRKITSLTDQDAKRKAMEHPAFANAGQQAGVEVWRIEDFEPVPVPTKDYGKFYKGDSYIILKTTSDKRNNLSWNIHYWLGASTSQDEAGAAAILSVGLDDKFNGAAIQHREVQGHESNQFVSYFQPAIRYVDGGHASGFSHVTTNAGAEKRLFQIKGKRNVRVRQVDPLISSMNKGDCFILDVDQSIYVYVGENAKNVEKLKAISVANQIRDQDHNGRGRVDIIDQYSSEVDTQKFFTALGSGNRALVPEESAGGDDQQFERGEEQTVTLSEISDKSGSLKITPLTKPYKQEQLNPEECYILDTVSGSIYVWVGKKSNQREKSEAMTKANQYLTAKNYPSWVHVTRIPQGTEPTAFKQYFSTWRDVGMTHSRLVRSASDAEIYDSDDEVSNRRAKIIAKTGTAREFMPDQGDGDCTVYRIEDLAPVLIYNKENPGTEPGKRFGEFYQGDSYVIKYESNGESRGYVIYYWLGKDTTQDEAAAAAIYSVTLDNELDGGAVIVRVPQGEEPKHFLKIFKGEFVISMGGKASGFKNSNQKDSYDTDGVRLFRVYGNDVEDIRAEQMAEESSSLSPDDVFILETPENVFLWYGEDSSDEEKSQGQSFIQKVLGSSVEFITLEQSDETDDFWKYLGNSSDMKKNSVWRDKLGKRLQDDAHLYEVALKSDNSVKLEEIPNYSQKSLHSDECYVLDSGDVIYVWVGQQVDRQIAKSAHTVAEGYLISKGRNPFDMIVIVVKQGQEASFVNYFDKWDADMWAKQSSYEEEKIAALEQNSVY